MQADYSARHHYAGQYAAEYDRTRTGTAIHRKRWQSELEAVHEMLTLLKKNAHWLDVPCGTGRFIPILRKHGCTMIGLDISEDMLRQIPREYLDGHQDVRTEIGDAEHLRFSDDTFDYVLSMRFFNIVPDRVRRNALKEYAIGTRMTPDVR